MHINFKLCTFNIFIKYIHNDKFKIQVLFNLFLIIDIERNFINNMPIHSFKHAYIRTYTYIM